MRHPVDKYFFFEKKKSQNSKRIIFVSFPKLLAEFLCSKGEERGHEWCGEECEECRQLGVVLRCRWRRQEQVEHVTAAMAHQGRWEQQQVEQVQGGAEEVEEVEEVPLTEEDVAEMVLELVMKMEGREKSVDAEEDNMLENVESENKEGEKISMEKKIEVEEEVIPMEPEDNEQVVKVISESQELEEEVNDVRNFMQLKSESPGEEDGTSSDTVEEVPGGEVRRIGGEEEVEGGEGGEEEVVLAMEVTAGARWLLENEMVGVDERKLKGGDEEKREVKKKKEKKTEKKTKEMKRMSKKNEEKVAQTNKEKEESAIKKKESDKKKEEREMREVWGMGTEEEVARKKKEMERRDFGRMRARERGGGDYSGQL